MIKSKKETICVVIAASILHLAVDLFSIYTVGSLVESANQKVMLIMLYNLFAFCFQMPIGLISDKINKNFYITCIGFVFLFFAHWIKREEICVFLVGIGNAMFHVGMGREILMYSEEKTKLPGIFVSTGAIGVYLGKQLVNSEIKIEFLFLIVLILLFFIKENNVKQKETKKKCQINKKTIFCVLLFALSVGIRAFIGTVKFENNFNNKLLIIVLATFFGKAFGGILSDKFGIVPTTVISLTLSIMSFLFSQNNYFLILGIFLFNMTMPITLTLISSILDDKKGFAFGITTFMLFLGSSLMYFDNMYIGYLVIPFLIIQIIAMICGFYIYKNMI